MKNLNKYLSTAVAALVLALSASVPAQASVIVDHSNGKQMNQGWTNNGPTGYVLWDTFTLASAASINEINYFSYHLGSVITADYTLKIGTAPGLSDVFSTSIAAANVTRTTLNGSVDSFDATLAPVVLNAGTYWLSFYNTSSNLYGAATVANGKLHQLGYGADYDRSGYSTDFILSGNTRAVPEPGTLALLGLGFAGLTLRRRKR